MPARHFAFAKPSVEVINPKDGSAPSAPPATFLSSEGSCGRRSYSHRSLVTMISTLTWTCLVRFPRFITSQRRKAMNWLFAASLLALIPLIVGDPT